MDCVNALNNCSAGIEGGTTPEKFMKSYSQKSYKSSPSPVVVSRMVQS